jgi:hypothetical protein
MKEALCSSETSVLTRATRRNIPEDAILHSHRRENLKSYILNNLIPKATHWIWAANIQGEEVRVQNAVSVSSTQLCQTYGASRSYQFPPPSCAKLTELRSYQFPPPSCAKLTELRSYQFPPPSCAKLTELRSFPEQMASCLEL